MSKRWIVGIVLAVYALVAAIRVVAPPVIEKFVPYPITVPKPAPKAKPKPVPIGSEFEVEVVRLVNEERVSRGLRPLKPEPKLMADAKSWSRNQANRHRMYHSRMGYGENVAVGQRTPREVVNAWMNSRGHRQNILSPNYSTIGTGVAYAGSTPYWTQTFK